MAYGISLSGLASAQEAIDVTSNNIANAQTIGYKSGEYVFADQFFRAQDPQNKDRAGMGAYRQAIRRNDNYGTIVNSANSLDMAITGKGMFILAKTIDGTVPSETPSKFQYTRNGQFGVDSAGRVVNQSGMYLVGYAADSSGKVNYAAKSVLTLNPTETLPQQATQNSKINLNLDDRVSTITGNAFSPTKPTTYSQSTSQTVYDSLGESHTLSLYYKKVASADLYLSGTSATGSTFTFDPTQSLGTTGVGEQSNQIASTAVASTVAGAEETIDEGTLKFISGGQESSTGVSEISISQSGDGYTDGVYRNVALTSATGGAYSVDTSASSSGITYVDTALVADGGSFVAGAGYDNDGTYYNVTLSSAAGNGSGAKATVKVLNGAVSSVAITTKGSGYLAGDDLYVSTAEAYSAGMMDTSTAPTTAFATSVLGLKAVTGYADGTYTNVSLSSNGSGTGALAKIVINNGAVSSFQITTAGKGYASGDELYVAASDAQTAGMKSSASVTTTTEGTGVFEVATVTFSNLTAGQTVILGGRTFTSTATTTAARVADAFANGTTTYGTVSGSVSGWTVVDNSDGTATFTSSTSGTQTDLTKTGTGTATVVTSTQGSGTAVAEIATATFQDLSSGETVIFAGRTFTAGSAGATAAQVAAVFALTASSTSGNSADGSTVGAYTGAVSGWTVVDNSDGTAEFTATVAGVKTNLSNTGAYLTTSDLVSTVVTNIKSSGNGAMATVIVKDGSISEVKMTAGGIGYASDDVLTIANGEVGGGTPVTKFKASVASLTSPTADQPLSGGVDIVDTNSSNTFVAGAGYDNNGTYYNVPLSTDGSGTGAYATIVVSGTAPNKGVESVTITTPGTGYASGDSLYISTANALSAGILSNGAPTTAFSTTVDSLVTTGTGVQGSTYTLTLRDGTILSVKQVSTSESGDFTYAVNADRFAVFATLDGNAVGQDASATNPVTVNIGGADTSEQISLGTMAFIGGKNIDSLAQDAFGTPQFTTSFTIDASAGEGTGYGQTINGGVVQLTLDSTDMTGYSSTAMTYDNTQDGHATAYISAYNVDSYGNLVATFDNGSQLTKGRVALAYFNNFEGLVPTGDNLFLASTNSGEAETGEYANEGVLGAIRSKALESSNVDLTNELVRLMVLQRHYSAVSQATKIQVATLVDDALNIGR